MHPVILSTAYLPNLQYLKQVIDANELMIETKEHYVKQTQRNRCEILSSTGAMRLSIPLVQKSDKEIICDKRISYAEKWQHQHWRSITTAYKSAPYFEFFEHEFKPFYENKHEFLVDYNTELLKTMLHILRIKKTIQLSSEYNEHISMNNASIFLKPYYQVFDYKLGFTPKLSCIDALFNVGLDTLLLL